VAANRASQLHRTVRLNQWVVSGRTLEGPGLDEAVRANVEYMARFLYDLHHAQGREKDERALVVIDETFERALEEAASGTFVFAGMHCGNFDLLGRVLGYNGWRLQILSVPEPGGAYQRQNEMRERAGFTVTPVSIEALKRAARELAEGRSVVSGIDRPIPNAEMLTPFFGHPAPLPLLHVRLAMRARVPVVMVTGRLHDDGKYRLVASEPVEMIGDRHSPDDVLENAVRCVVEVERIIAEAPAQWSMPHPVWPDLSVPD
jgi:lauroyl/myristoyl acyltransferase